MKTTTSNHKSKEPTAGHHFPVHSDIAGAAPESTATPSNTMVEACDRLAEKLDEVAGIFREQLQAWQQMREPAAAILNQHELAPSPALASSLMGPSSNQVPALPPRQTDEPSGPADQSIAITAENARRLADTLSLSRDAQRQQMDNLRQSLEAIMEFLERQAAEAAPKLDASEIMSRLQNIEEQQQNLQSQFNTNRWGPS